MKRQQGAVVHVAFLTDGSRGCSEDSCLTPDQLAEVRTNESLAALRVLGLPASSLTFSEGLQMGVLDFASGEEKMSCS